MNECVPDGIKYKDDNKSEPIIENGASINPYPTLAELICNVSKIIKEARHNDLMYPELAEISTYRDLNIWIHKHYRLFYSVFQTDLLCVMASIPKHHL